MRIFWSTFLMLALTTSALAQLPSGPGQMPGMLPSPPMVAPPPPPVAPPPVPPSVRGQPIQGLSPRSGTYVPYAGSSTLRSTATPKPSKQRKGKRHRPRTSDIFIVRQI
jgi:hypothetical protein